MLGGCMDIQRYTHYIKLFTDQGLGSTAVGLIMGFLFGTSFNGMTLQVELSES